jgi:hypothetical protein
MTHWKIAILLAALPSLALPQSNALDQARGTQAVQDKPAPRPSSTAPRTRPSRPERTGPST